MDSVSNQTLVGEKEQDYTHDTIRFTREGNVPDSSQPHALLAEQHLGIVSDPVSHDIADFCRRPYKIGSFTWKSGGGPGTQYVEIFAAEKLRETTIFEKLKGFLGITATFCFRVVVNAQPTQVGGLIMSFYPGQHRLINKGSGDTIIYSAQAESLLPRYTGMPSAIINIASTSEAELKVAYKGEEPIMRLIDGEAGVFRINQFSPLLGATNAESVSVTIYMWLEDLKTYAAIPYGKLANATLQGMTTEQEAKAVTNTKGIISKGFDMVGNIAALASSIPTITMYALPVSWLAKGAAGIARWFGYSKPADTTPSKAMTINPFKDFAHGSGVLANQTKLTVNDNQEIEVRPLGPTNEDEMSIAFLTKRPTYWLQFNWATSSAEGTALLRTPILPGILARNFQYGDKRLIANTTVSYLANMFEYWRGNLLFTFTVFASKFHSGRLRFTYVPVNLEDQVVTEQLQYTYSHIVDIRDSNTFTIKVPYISTRPFKRYDEDHGTLYVFVENPLISHPSTTSTINITCMVSGEDLAFSGPRILPDLDNCTGMALPNPKPPSVKLQGFATAPANDAPHIVDITNKNTKDHSILAFKHAIGDPIVSLRTLAKRMTYNSSYTGKLDADSCIVIQANSLVKTNKTEPATNDYIDAISALYKFRSGGTRFTLAGNLPPNMSYKFTPLPESDTKKFTRGVATWGSLNVAVRSAQEYYSMANFVTIPYANAISGALQVEVPYYHTTPVVENGRNDLLPADLATAKLLADFNVPLFVITSPLPADTYDIQLYRSGADDFNCGYFTGPPMQIHPNTPLGT